MVGLYALEEIFEQVSETGLSGEFLEAELLRMVRIYNYVPDDLAGEYRAAISREYDRYVEEGKMQTGP